MTFDRTIPDALKKTQQWFGSIISRPIDMNSQMNPTSPSGIPMIEEALQYISPGPVLRSDQRIELYNQQYWWRLLSTMHEAFPFATRLFGYHDFNQLLSVPYLTKYPPRHWSLNLLGDRFPKWIQEDYHAPDKSLIYQVAQIDWAYGFSFCSEQHPALDFSNLPSPGDLSSITDKTLYLQSHIHLFMLDSNLFAARDEFLKQDPDFWIENDFPEVKRFDKEQKGYYVLFRDTRNNMGVETITRTEYELLKLFEKGASIDHACDWLERQDKKLHQEADSHLHLWFQQWIIRQWFTLIKLT